MIEVFEMYYNTFRIPFLHVMSSMRESLLFLACLATAVFKNVKYLVLSCLPKHIILGYIGKQVRLFMQFSEQYFRCKCNISAPCFTCFNIGKYQKTSSLNPFRMRESYY